MNPSVKRRLRIAATLGATAALTAVAAGPASADDVDVINTETVQIYMSATGEVDTQRVYEQLTLMGKGKVDLTNPVSPESLRNLDGFSGFDIADGEQVISTEVDGKDTYRSVSDFEGELPLDIQVEYKLDGKTVEPGDVVGADGELEVIYTVENVTSAPQKVTFADGQGGTVTKTVEVPIPLVGSLTTNPPSSFSNVRSGQANLAGDGKGGTKLSFTMTLFPPIGSTTAVFGYTADIADGVVPRTDVTVLPVNPLESPTFKSAAASYQGGADTGAALASGATEIDSNLLKLRDGAAELLAGLIQLNDGAIQLSDGLSNDAAPGARKLADGAGRLDAGLGELASGANQLADGTDAARRGGTRLADGAERLSGGVTELDGGVGDLSDGAGRLAEGQRKLAAGLAALYSGVDQLPQDLRTQIKANPEYNRLLGALSGMAAGIGSRNDSPATKTLLGGLNKLQLGLNNPGSTLAGCEAKDPTRCGAANALDFIAGALSQALAEGGSVATLRQNILNIGQVPDCGPVCRGTVTATANGVVAAQTASLTELRTKVQDVASGIRAGITAPGAGLDQIRAGLSTGVDPVTCSTAPSGCGIKEAADFLRLYGIPMLVDGIAQQISDTLLENIGEPTPGCDPEKTLRCAAAALADGGKELTDGVAKLVAGVSKLQAGGADLAAGAGTLSSGLGQLDEGASKLAAGAGDAEDGSGQIADGADELADGLGTAADGSQRLADGLGQAAQGAPQLVDGAQRLSDEGTKKLVAAGQDTTQSYGEMVAVMNAGAERAQAEDMALGAPEDAIGLTAYSFILQGDDGESGRNVTRGLLGLALLGAGAGVFALRRRIV
ncbi:hypothetical protein [Nocardioides pyridinolyticus]